MDIKLQLILAALKQVKTTGLYGLSMAPLAKQAQVAVGKFYYHFKSKNDLLDHMYIYCFQELEKVIDSEKDGKKNLKKQFINIYKALFAFFESNAEIHTFIVECTASGVISHHAQREANRYIAGLYHLISDGMEQQKFRVFNPEIATQMTLFTLFALLTYQQQSGEKLVNAEIEDAALLAFNGLKKVKK